MPRLSHDFVDDKPNRRRQILREIEFEENVDSVDEKLLELACPNCGENLEDFETYGLVTSKCRKCEGIWITGRELDRVQLEEDFLEKISKPIFVDASKFSVKKSGNSCPDCSLKLQELSYSDSSSIVTLACSGCDGVWINKKEIQKVHEYLSSKNKKFFKSIDDEVEAFAVSLKVFSAEIAPYAIKLSA